MDDSPLAASRRVKENRWHNRKVEVAPAAPPPLPGQGIGSGLGNASGSALRAPVKKLEERDEIQGFLKETGPLADGVRRFLQVMKQKRTTLQNEWDLREAMQKFTRDYAYAVPGADKEYIRGLNLALNVYLGGKGE